VPHQANANSKAITFITDFAKSLVPRAEIAFSHGALRVANEGKQFSVPISREDLDDLEPVLDGDLPTKYSDGMKSAIQLQIYLAFFHEGLIPNVKLSKVMLEEKRDWTTAIRAGTHFDDELAMRLYRGLKRLESYLDHTLQKHGEIQGVRKDLDAIRVLTAGYQNNGNLNFGMLGRDALSFLKGAAVLAIMELEDKKNTSSAKRVTDRYDADILLVVQVFESRPYDQIKLPAVLFECLQDDIPSARASVPALAVARTTLAAAADLDELLRSLNPRLVDRRQGAWQTLHSDNPDAVSQAVNSMVEVMGEVISLVRKRAGNNPPLKDLLPTILSSEGQSDWVLTTHKWISETKSALQSVKHNTAAQPKHIASAAMTAAELVIQILLA
jgi:hypothetical protein